MSYRNKTYVAFASEDIHLYRLMQAWRENDKIDFDFFDAHALFVARDTSKPETIRDNLRQRMKNAKQVVIIGTSDAKRKGSDGSSFLAHEVKVMMEYNLPIVVANHDGDRTVDKNFIPTPLLNADYFTVSTSFQPAIIRHALNDYAPDFASSSKTGPHQYPAAVYSQLGLVQ
ncbi:TIR domain-containing protein [Microbacterium aquilitoris]|uniref:TIR domain-containing protein n=1 Tax=Microbacterium aquilitoris TaxID=3067307 RepID=UPI002890AE23|nr:TIR domain-containing protein [Microbacterium sp. KSW2-22]MDT3344468.1 TIR domain-containing protein [Microbacterium sp. KSW2-22]